MIVPINAASHDLRVGHIGETDSRGRLQRIRDQKEGMGSPEKKPAGPNTGLGRRAGIGECECERLPVTGGECLPEAFAPFSPSALFSSLPAGRFGSLEESPEGGR